MAQANIDEDNDYENDERLQKSYSFQSKDEQDFDYANHVMRFSAQNAYQQSSPNPLQQDASADDDYASFFKIIGQCSHFQDADDHIASDADLQYDRFLSFLKPYKNSYKLDFVNADKTSISFAYEDDDTVSDQLKHDKSKNVLENRNRKAFKSTNEPFKPSQKSVTKNSTRVENARHPSHRGNSIVGPEHMSSIDVSYQLSLAQKFNEKARRKAMGLQASNDKKGKGHALAEGYENSGTRSAGPKVAQEVDGAIVPLRKTPDDKCGKDHRLSRYSKRATKRKLLDNVTEDTTGLHTLHADQSSRKKSRPTDHNQPGSRLKIDGLVDDCYKSFLSGLRENEGHLVFHSEDGTVVTYGQYLQKSCDDSLMIIGDRENDLTDCKISPSVSKKSHSKDVEVVKRQTFKDSSFRKGLMNILSKPYDNEQFESLMKEVNKRRPLGEDDSDNLEEQQEAYEPKRLGKSYLYHHKDVAKAIKECRGDRQRVLNLLRGFMYWLEHVSHYEAFKPWNDKECLEVQPQKLKPSKKHKV